MEEFSQRAAEIDSCVHKFCFQCILQWSNISNTCPLCKIEFRNIRSDQQTVVVETKDRRHVEEDQASTTADMSESAIGYFLNTHEYDFGDFVVPDDDPIVYDSDKSDGET